MNVYAAQRIMNLMFVAVAVVVVVVAIKVRGEVMIMM
jgi:hypothetical protein